jgi:hypothetical protein
LIAHFSIIQALITCALKSFAAADIEEEASRLPHLNAKVIKSVPSVAVIHSSLALSSWSNST